MKRLAFVPTLFLLLAAPTAWADVIHLRDGRKIEGEAEWRGDKLEVKTRHGSVSLHRRQIVRVEETESPREAYERRRSALADGDLDAQLELGVFCAENDLEEEARELVLGVLDQDAEHRAARRAIRESLDFHLVEGEWLAPEAYYPERGYKKISGRWLSPEEQEERLAKKRLRRARKDAKVAEQQARRADRGRSSAEEDLDEAASRQGTAVARVSHYEGELRRIGKSLNAARDDLQEKEDALRDIQRETTQTWAVYEAWIVRGCICPKNTNTCACRYELRRLELHAAAVLFDQRNHQARNARNRARDEVDRLEADEVTAGRLLSDSRQELEAAKVAHARAEREYQEASEVAESAEAEQDQATDQVEDAQDAVDDAR